MHPNKAIMFMLISPIIMMGSTRLIFSLKIIPALFVSIKTCLALAKNEKTFMFLILITRDFLIRKQRDRARISVQINLNKFFFSLHTQ